MKTSYQFDNKAVRNYLNPYFQPNVSFTNLLYAKENAVRLPDAIESAIVGACYLGQNGHVGQPKTNPDVIFSLLATQDELTTKSLTECLGGRYKKSAIDLYQAAAKVASNAISEYSKQSHTYVANEQLLWRNPESDFSPMWSQEEIDAWKEARELYKTAIKAGKSGTDLSKVHLPDHIYKTLNQCLLSRINS